MGVEAAHNARRAFLIAAAVTATVAAAARPGDATAAAPPPTPGISQYVETVPTSSGGTANQSPAKTTQRGHRRVTPAQVAAIASSPAYGAPQSRLSLHPTNGQPTGTGQASGEDANAITAAVSAVDGNDDSRFIWLACALLLITASAVAAATLSYRRGA
jgi:hypothetical protein